MMVSLDDLMVMLRDALPAEVGGTADDGITVLEQLVANASDLGVDVDEPISDEIVWFLDRAVDRSRTLRQGERLLPLVDTVRHWSLTDASRQRLADVRRACNLFVKYRR